MDADSKKQKQQKKKGKQERSTGRWAVQVFFIAVVLSAALSLASDQALDGAGLAVAFVVLLSFILLGIVFDIIGVSVTAADEKPFHSMAARKTPGAREALNLIRKADKVSSFCNDVVGDICGIISGSTGAVIVVQIQSALGAPGGPALRPDHRGQGPGQELRHRQEHGGTPAGGAVPTSVQP